MFLALSLPSPHASTPSLTTEVFINQRTPGRGVKGYTRHDARHEIAVPPISTWTLDTVRAIVVTLRRYLPAHAVTAATARIAVSGRTPYARVEIRVDAGDWQAEAFFPSLRANWVEAGDSFTTPMLATVRELRSRSPFAVASLAPVDVTTTTELPSHAKTIDIATLITQLPADKQRACRELFRRLLDEADSAGDDE